MTSGAGDERRVVVIGSGPAGATAAWTLLQHGIPVTLLESGAARPRGLRVRAFGRDLLTRLPTRDREQRHVASDDPSAVWHCELFAGGLSNWWAGATPRFSPEDFSEGERLDARYRWPLDYADLRPYYQRVERLMPISGTGADAPCVPACEVTRERTLPPDWRAVGRAAAAAGQAFIPLPVADTARFEVTGMATWFNSFDHVLARVPRSADLRLVLGAHALRVEHDGRAPARASAVVYRERASGLEHRVPAAAVVIAAGTLSSTQLLLASTSPAFPDGLGNTNGVLGRYLHDHPARTSYLRLERPLTTIPVAAYLSRAPYASSEPLRAASGQLRNVTFLRSVAGGRPGVRRTHDIAGTWFGTIIPTEQTSALLHRERTDAFGLPWMDIRVRHDQTALATMDAACDRFLEFLADAGHGRAVVRTMARPPGDSVHYGGTARMHASPRYGVLNGFGRMHAVPNVVVADAAAFTTGAEKNPTLTVMALAARASEKLASDLRSGGE